MKKVFYLALIFDVFIFPEISDILTIILILFWLFNVIKLKVAPREDLVLAVIAYSFSFVSQFFDLEMVMEKSISWFTIFLTIALVQKLTEKLARKRKNA